MAIRDQELTRLETGLDALEVPIPRRARKGRTLWRAMWPKLVAAAIVFGIWEFLWLIEWKPRFAFPSPGQAVSYIFEHFDVVSDAARTTLGRGIEGFLIA